MYYIEFFRKREGVPIDEFHKHVREDYEGWMKEHPEDELVLLIGRTWRLGPTPGYICIWKLKDFSRLDAMKQEMPPPHEMEAAPVVIEYAGCYEEFGEEQI